MPTAAPEDRHRLRGKRPARPRRTSATPTQKRRWTPPCKRPATASSTALAQAGLPGSATASSTALAQAGLPGSAASSAALDGAQLPDLAQLAGLQSEHAALALALAVPETRTEAELQGYFDSGDDERLHEGDQGKDNCEGDDGKGDHGKDNSEGNGDTTTTARAARTSPGAASSCALAASQGEVPKPLVQDLGVPLLHGCPQMHGMTEEDCTPKLVPSQRGAGRKLVYKGNLYSKRSGKRERNTGLTRWNCVHYRKEKSCCPAYVLTDGAEDAQLSVVASLGQHNHEKEPQRLLQHKVIGDARDLALQRDLG